MWVCVRSCVRMWAHSATAVSGSLHPMGCSLPGYSVHGIPQREYWSVLPFPSPRDLPDPGIKSAPLELPALVSRFFTTGPPGKPQMEGSKSIHTIAILFLLDLKTTYIPYNWELNVTCYRHSIIPGMHVWNCFILFPKKYERKGVELNWLLGKFSS